MKKLTIIGVLSGLLLGLAFLAIFSRTPDYTLNTSGKNVPHSVTPEDCLTGQYPRAALEVCVIYLQALNQRIKH